MENLHESPADCKPRITALAQLVALYAECRGVTLTAELVAATGYTERAIRKAKAELGCRNQGAAGTRVPEPQCRPRNQGAVSEPQCRNQGADSASRTHAHIELPSEVLDTKKEVKEESPFTPGERVRFENGRLELCSDLVNFWLGEFGGDQKNLDLALIQSAAYVQPNSSRPLEAQIGSQLARMVRDTRDRDKRYAAAVTAKTASPPKQAKKSTAVWMRELAAEMEAHQ